MPLQKVIFGMGVAWLLVAVTSIGLVYGQTSAAVEESSLLGRDLSLTIGFDIWLNQWETSTTASFGDPQVSSIQSLTEFSVAFIPSVTLTYKNFFISGSYTATPEYDFGKVTNVNIAVFPDITFSELQETHLKASRQELDFTLGYFPLNWLGVAIGYKGVFQDYEAETRTLLLPPLAPVLTEVKSTPITRYQGPIFGVLGSARITDSFALLGNAFGGYMFVDCSPECPDFGNGTYASSKLVLRYTPTPLPRLSLTLGYRVQVINTEVDGYDSNAIDLTHGPVFGVYYRF